MKTPIAPSLDSLPPPPCGKSGWPWTEESPALPECLPNGTAWPRITIVTPSFNQADYLEETIRSILLQRYPNLEYIIIDGGSSDRSVEIIQKYQTHLAHWVSEPDRGQTHAINKGLSRATGELLAYINSDDFYLPGALRRVAECHAAHPEADLFHGRCQVVDARGEVTGERFASITRYDEIIDLWGVWWNKRNFVQPEVFWTKRITGRIGLLREDLHWVMDYEYWARILAGGGVVTSIDAPLAGFRLQPNQKSMQSEKSADEQLKVVQHFLWRKTPRLPFLKRIQLQGQWLYQRTFLPAVPDSVSRGESRIRRWARLLGVCVKHPQIFTAASIRRRLASIISAK